MAPSTVETSHSRRNLVIYATIGVVGFALLRSLPLIGAHPGGGIDSIGYEAQAKLPLFSHGIFAGAWPPVYPLVLKALRYHQTAAVVFQMIVGVIAWVFLAFMASRAAHHFAVRAACFVIVLAIGGSFVVMEWDSIIGTDSRSISLNVALFATVFWLCERFTTTRIVLFGAIALTAALDRDTNGMFFAVVAAVIIVAVLICRLPRPWAAISAILLACALLSSLSATGGQRWAIPLKDVISVRLLKSPERTGFLVRHGMPLTPQEIKDIAGNCVMAQPTPFCATGNPQFFRWIHDHGRSVYVRLLLAYPATTVAEPFTHLDESLGTRVKVEPASASGTLERSPISEALDTVVFLMNPTALVIASFAFLAACIALWTRGRRGPFTIAAILVLLVAAHLWLVWTGGALEVTRHSLVASVQLRLGLWLGSLYIIDALLHNPIHELPDRAAHAARNAKDAS